MASLVSLMGGPESFVSRLNYLHESGLNYIGNEPSFLTVFQYHYAGRPALSSYRSHTYIPAYFSTNTSGLPGNDDSGMHIIESFTNLGKHYTYSPSPIFSKIQDANSKTFFRRHG